MFPCATLVANPVWRGTFLDHDHIEDWHLLAGVASAPQQAGQLCSVFLVDIFDEEVAVSKARWKTCACPITRVRWIEVKLVVWF